MIGAYTVSSRQQSERTPKLTIWTEDMPIESGGVQSLPPSQRSCSVPGRKAWSTPAGLRGHEGLARRASFASAAALRAMRRKPFAAASVSRRRRRARPAALPAFTSISPKASRASSSVPSRPILFASEVGRGRTA